MVFNLSTVHDIYVFIDGFAPFKTAMDFDNPGLLVGSGGTAVKTALLSLDITPDVVDEAALLGAQLIISHHPVIFNPLKELVPGTAPFMLVKAGIAAVCAHTNLDMAPGGVNDCLAARLKLKNIKPLVLSQNSGLPEALYGETACAFEPDEFADFVKQSLSCGGLSYTDGGSKITKVGLCGGGGADMVYDAAARGCQAFVTGESKHNILIDACRLGVTFVDAGHFYTEDVVIEPLMNKLKKQFTDVNFIKSKRMRCPVKFI